MQDQMKELKRSEGDLGGVAVEISQSLVELDNKVKELLDETLPNPASLFETVQSTTNTYIGMAMSVPKPQANAVSEVEIDSNQTRALTNMSSETAGSGSSVENLIASLEGNGKKTDFGNIIKNAYDRALTDVSTLHGNFKKLLNDAVILEARLDALYPKFVEELKQTVSVELADCRDLGITSPFMVMPKNIEIAAGEVGEITISGGRRPIYASFNRQRAGVTIEDSVNKFGDTVISIRWDGRAGVAGDYPIEFVDYSGAKDVGLVTFLPGIRLEKSEFVVPNQDKKSFTLNVPTSGGAYSVYYLEEGAVAAPNFKISEQVYTFGVAQKASEGKITFTVSKLPAAGVVWRFLLVEEATGLSTNFTVSAA